MLKPKLFSIIKHRDVELNKSQIINDVIAGIIVAIIALPLSVALGIASGVTPEKGLITAIIAGFFISFLGGSRVQIGGPTGAFVIILYGIVSKYGGQGLTVATIMAGIFMIFFGFMRLGSVIKYIPYPITTGFTSGIAVVLFSTQVKDLLGLSIKEVPSEFFDKWQAYFSNLSTIDITTMVVGLVSLLIIVISPKINKTIPGSLIALVVATLAVKVLHLPVDTIGSRFGEISSSITFINLEDFHINISIVKELIRPAITIAFLASVESLLSAVVADGMIGKKHNSNMELIAQGVANIASALFGGIPATGAIARTAANVKSGGRTPIAGIVHALMLLVIMLVFMPFAKFIPMTTLSAILVIVSYNMSEWRSFKGLLKSTKSDIAVLMVTFLFTILFDLVIAIEIAMVIAMFLFVKRMSESTQIENSSQYYKDNFEESEDEDEYSILAQKDNLHEHLGSKILLYEINGPLFFGAANTFIDIMNEIKSDSNIIIFKMKNVPNMDATAFNVLKTIDKKCKEKHILILYSEVNEQPMKLMINTGFVSKIGEDCFFESTERAIKTANEIINCKVSL
ncbi:sodium-independent anion transporter [Clostridium polyendosporum]|uniref:Sodium-independent anion transporter n=1 Tax=Clostridium polyendosporum TaxID=69208 RepID=A0A919VKI1_9CLOT|nr:SulP family inorganic anion transporter [Clostridium polyendosporum]GIM27633.1 sodium-independent anion transporter [Clostridium polyendosporum]